MRLPVIASASALAAGLVSVTALLSLPVPALGQDPDLGRLLFEVGASVPAASPTVPPPAETGAAAGGKAAAGVEGDAADPDSIPEDEEAGVLASIDEYERAVVDLEQTYGPFTHDLAEQLQVLGGLYEKVGNYESAIATYEKAVHIMRVNDGLFTLEQTPLVKDIIRSYQAMDDYEEADNRQEYLYYVKQKNYDDGHPEMIQAMFDWADWNVQAYYRQIGEGESTLTITQSAGPLSSDFIPVYGPNGMVYYVPRNQAFSGYALNNSILPSGSALGMQYMLDPRLRTARDLYEEIAEQAEEDGAQAAGEALPETERKLANISYIVKQEMDYMESRISSSNFSFNRSLRPEYNPEVSRGYAKGRDYLESALEKLREDPEADPRRIALAIIDLADWQLTFERPQAAYEGYREAHQVLAEAGLGAQEIEKVFAPTPAVEIPTYATHRYSRATLGIPADAEISYRGHIDLKLDVDQYGNPRGLEVEGMSPDTPHDVREALLDHIRLTKLRPRLVEGEAVEQEDIVLRYYYSY